MELGDEKHIIDPISGDWIIDDSRIWISRLNFCGENTEKKMLRIM